MCWSTVSPETAHHLREVPWHLALLPFGLVACAWCSNAARLWLMTRSLGHRLPYHKLLAVSLSAEFGLAATPAGTGGAVIHMTLLHRLGVPYSTTASILSTDILLDLLCLLLVSPLGLLILWRDPEWNRVLAQGAHLDWSVVGGIVSAVVLALALMWRHGSRMHAVGAAAGRTAWGRRLRLGDRLHHWHTRLVVGLRRTRSRTAHLLRHKKRALVLNLLLTMMQWVCRYGTLPMILFALGRPANPLPLLFLQGLLFVLSLAVVVPGGGGSVEALTPLVLRSFVGSPSIGLVLLLWRFFTFHLYLFVGGAIFFWLCRPQNRFLSADRQTVAARLDSTLPAGMACRTPSASA